jgi:hypothetical protein
MWGSNATATPAYPHLIDMPAEMQEAATMLKRSMNVFATLFLLALLAPARFHAQTPPKLKLSPHTITLANGKTFSLNIPEGFDISIAAEGLKRVRFMAKAPDGRLFVTDMYNRADNSRGMVYILDGFDPKTGNSRGSFRIFSTCAIPTASLSRPTQPARTGSTWRLPTSWSAFDFVPERSLRHLRPKFLQPTRITD